MFGKELYIYLSKITWHVLQAKLASHAPLINIRKNYIPSRSISLS